MKKFTTCLLLMSALAVILGLFSCVDEAGERAKLREKLDEEFEKETEALVKKSTELDAALNKLMHAHQELDLKFDELDQTLKGKEISEADKKLQKQHLALEVKHSRLFKEAEDQLKRFEQANALHEEMEKAHATVKAEDIMREHQEFEQTLRSFSREFSMMVAKFKNAEDEQKTIKADHQHLKDTYMKQEKKD